MGKLFMWPRPVEELELHHMALIGQIVDKASEFNLSDQELDQIRCIAERMDNPQLKHMLGEMDGIDPFMQIVNLADCMDLHTEYQLKLTRAELEQEEISRLFAVLRTLEKYLGVQPLDVSRLRRRSDIKKIWEIVEDLEIQLMGEQHPMVSFLRHLERTTHHGSVPVAQLTYRRLLARVDHLKQSPAMPPRSVRYFRNGSPDLVAANA